MPEELIVPRVEWEPEKVSASIVIGDEECRIWIAASEDLFQETDFLLPILLLPAMKVGVTLKLPGKVSAQLLSSTPQIQDIFSMWESLFRHVAVEVEARNTVAANRGTGVVCFFSGGVDSFYALLRHREEISHLIYIHRSADERFVVDTGVQRAREVARELGKSLIEVETNLPALAKQTRITWKYYHGMWIASIALLFQHMFHRVLIAGSTTSNYDNLRPQGTHPILDPLWSTELTSFNHDGCEARRVDKAAYISEYEIAMDRLQICDQTLDVYNCGHCEKCLRTMLALKATGALQRCKTLPDELDVEAITNMDLSSYSASYFARENLRALERLGTEPELVRALKEALDRGGRIIAHSGYKEEELERIKARLWTSQQKIKDLSEKNRKLRARNRKLARQNLQLSAARSSEWRHRLAARLVKSAYRIPGIVWLSRR